MRLSSEIVEVKQVVDVLVQRFAYHAATSRQASTTTGNQGDQNTADLFTEISRSLDKNLWFLEAHLQE